MSRGSRRPPRSGGGRSSGGGPRRNDRRDGGGGDRGRSRKGGGAPRSNAGGAGRPSSRRPARGLGGDRIEGRQAVRELLLAGTRRVREISIIEDQDRADVLDDITELAGDMKVPVRRLPRKRFEALATTSSHQGVLADAAPLPEADIDALARRSDAFLLVLDGITDPGNLGALLRTAECAGVTGVVLGRHRAVHVSPTVAKTAAGAIEHLPIAVAGGIPTAITTLTDAGVLTVGLDMDGPTDLFDAPIDADTPVALVLGAEGAGLGRLVRERVDVVASIPMAGHLNSLNVAMAGAVAMFDVRRRREQAAS